MKVILLITMFNLVSFFRGFSLDTVPFKFGKGIIWKVIGPFGFLLGSKLSHNEIDNKIAYIIGLIFNIVILLSLLFF